MGKHRRGLVGTLAVATALVVLAVFLAGAMTLWVLDVTKDFGADLAGDAALLMGVIVGSLPTLAWIVWASKRDRLWSL